MAKEFQLTVVAPDREVVSETVQAVVAPGAAGSFGVLASHAPTISLLNTGLLEYLDMNNRRHYVAVGGGFAEVDGKQMTILADSAQRAQEIDIQREEQVLEQARRALRGEDSTMDPQQAMVEMERAINRIKTARNYGNL